MIRRFDAMNQKTETCKQRRRWWDCLVNASGNLSSSIFMFGPYFAGAILALNGEIAIGTVVSVANLCGSISWSIRELPGFWASRKAAGALIGKAAEVVQENTVSHGSQMQPVCGKESGFPMSATAMTAAIPRRCGM